MDAFFYSEGDGKYRATPLCRGPWDARFQHGGPPSALLVGALARHGEDAGGYFLARVSVELLRPIPLGLLEMDVSCERTGRTVERLIARLVVDGATIALARGLRIRRTEGPVTSITPLDPWPDPSVLTSFEFPFFRSDIGYHRAVDFRIAVGDWGRTPIAVWARARVPLVAGRASTPLEQVTILVDAQSGMGVPLDPRRWRFVNPDLHLFLEREPASGWVGMDIRSVAGPQGSGLSQSALRDRNGGFGRSAQTLVVSSWQPASGDAGG